METPKFFHVLEKRTAGTDVPHAPHRYRFAPFELDIERHVLLRDGLLVPLPPKCFDLLCILVKNSGNLLHKDRLMHALWPDTFVEEANLSNLIALLRKALGDSPSKSQYIKTVPKLGYRFATPIEMPFAIPEAPPGLALVQRQHPIRIIAFPFRTAAGFDDRHNLAFSLPEDISCALAELNAFTVRSIQVAMGFDTTRWDPKLIAKEADVDFIIAGTLGPGDFGLRITIQLIEARNGTLLWSKTWDVGAGELLRLHQGVVQLVARSLVRDAAELETASVPATAKEPEAYQLYLMANQLCLNRSPENMSLARDLYVASLEKDPDFAPAWARLGRCYRFLEKFGTELCADGSAEKAFERAFALNPDLLLAHCIYTPVQADSGQAEGAMIRLLGTLATHQTAPELFAALVHACRYCGQLDSSLAAHRRAMELDPKAQTSVAHTYFLLADYERALFWYGARTGVYLDALILACMGRGQEAAALLWTRKDKFRMIPIGMHSLAAYLRGDREGGIAVLRSEDPLIDPELRFYMARQAARFGDIELANQLLLRSVEEGYWSSVALERDPWLEPLRPTPEFRRISELVMDRDAKSRVAFIEAGGEALLDAHQS